MSLGEFEKIKLDLLLSRSSQTRENMSYLSNLSHFKRATNISVSQYLFLNALCSPQIRNTFYKTWHLRNQGHFGDQKSSLKTSHILTCFLSRVTLHPPKQEKNFSSSGAQRELTLILREIRVNTRSLSICTSIWRYTVRSVIVNLKWRRKLRWSRPSWGTTTTPPPSRTIGSLPPW